MGKKIRKRRNIGREAFNVVAKYEGQLELVEFEVIKAPKRQRSAIREAFNFNGKNNFYKHFAQNKPHILKRLGFSDQDISIMTEHGMRHPEVIVPKKFGHFSIDHGLSIHWGGDNKTSNLCLMPAEINSLKESLESEQTRDKKKGGFFTIKTIMPVTKSDGSLLDYVVEQTANRDRRKTREKRKTRKNSMRAATLQM